MKIEAFVYERIERLKEKMAEGGIETVILQKPENVFYFSNFNPVLNSHPAFMVITLEDDPCLLVHAIRFDHAAEEGSVRKVELYGKWGANASLDMDPINAIKIITGEKKGKIGMEEDYVSLEFAQSVLKEYSQCEIEPISNRINRIKIVKDEYEISRIRMSAALVDEGVRHTIQGLREGLSEAEASTKGQYAMRQMWHRDFRNSEVCGFGTSEGGMIDSLHVWCLSNGHIAYGCDCPKHYHPQEGDLCLPMAWAKTDGYHAENERTIIIGKPDAFKKNAYDGMLKARESMFNILKPGVLFEDLYLAAVKVYTDYGFGHILPGRVGHGVGCSAHEFPSLAAGNKLPLESGMVITVEPGLMDRNWGGVRHSDTVLITENGFESLTKSEAGEIMITIG